jgi:hypothetical protein
MIEGEGNWLLLHLSCNSSQNRSGALGKVSFAIQQWNMNAWLYSSEFWVQRKQNYFQVCPSLHVREFNHRGR